MPFKSGIWIHPSPKKNTYLEKLKAISPVFTVIESDLVEPGSGIVAGMMLHVSKPFFKKGRYIEPLKELQKLYDAGEIK